MKGKKLKKNFFQFQYELKTFFFLKFYYNKPILCPQKMFVYRLGFKKITFMKLLFKIIIFLDNKKGTFFLNLTFRKVSIILD